MLERMRSAGFWVLDASILSLSGYQKVAPVENRPFSRAPYTKGLEREILELSWRDHVDATFSSVMSSPNPPVLAAYRRIAHLLPPQWRSRAEPLMVFPPRAGQARYRESTFSGGTETFRRKGAEACLNTCLRF
jgi:hypothetical protein